jgi:two-component system CheB/CheR fusion protein
MVLQAMKKEINSISNPLQDAYEYAQAIVETVREPLIILDADLRVKSANEAFYKLFCVTPEETKNCFLYDLGNHQWDIPDLRKLLEEILPLETSFENYEVNHVFRDIGAKTMLLNARRILSQGQSTLTLLAIEDVTERTSIRRHLEEVSDYAQAIVETVREPLIIFDADLRVQSANQAFYKLFCVTPEETKNSFLYDLGNHQWDIPDLRKLLEDILPLQTTLEDYEVTHNFRDIGAKTMLLNARRILSQGQSTLTLLAIEDITERKRLRNELQTYSENLRDADRRKDEFLAMLAHELRNPLAPISNALQVLKSANTSAELTSKMHEMMRRQLNHLIRLIDDLLDISRITSGKIELHMEPVDLAIAVQNAVENSGPMITAASQKLTVTLPADPLWLKTDAARLTQILGNLLSNASKYTKENQKIWLTVKRDGNDALIEVKDTGIGIPAKMLSNIFDMFFQVDTSLARAQGGLGIGLTLVKNLVVMQGGNITAASAGPGQGATFIVRLPLVSKLNEVTQVSPQSAGEVVSDNTTNRRVLVVDDNEPSAETMGWWMEALGHQVQLAYNGTDALAKAKDFLPDLVLLDIGLPGMNGYDVCRAMRREPLLKNTMIVAQTGWGQKEHREQSEKAGFDHHLVKPVDLDALKKLLI